MTDAELQAIRTSVNRGTPWGTPLGRSGRQAAWASNPPSAREDARD